MNFVSLLLNFYFINNKKNTSHRKCFLLLQFHAQHKKCENFTKKKCHNRLDWHERHTGQRAGAREVIKLFLSVAQSSNLSSRSRFDLIKLQTMNRKKIFSMRIGDFRQQQQQLQAIQIRSQRVNNKKESQREDFYLRSRR